MSATGGEKGNRTRVKRMTESGSAATDTVNAHFMRATGVLTVDNGPRMPPPGLQPVFLQLIEAGSPPNV
jgi:hypothetical protein